MIKINARIDDGNDEIAISRVARGPGLRHVRIGVGARVELPRVAQVPLLAVEFVDGVQANVRVEIRSSPCDAGVFLKRCAVSSAKAPPSGSDTMNWSVDPRSLRYV